MIIRSLLTISALSFVLISMTLSCSPRTERRYLTAAEMGILPTSFEAGSTGAQAFRREPCYVPLNYAPDTNYLDHTPMKYLRINFHWMNSADGTENLPEAEAREYMEGLLHAANYALENNKKMWLPHDNDTPVLPINIRYVLTGRPDDPDDDGIYFHYDDSLYYYVHQGRKHSNLFSRDVIDKYGVQLDTVLNIFLMPHQPDSVASPTYGAGDVGVALRNALKVAGQWKQAYEGKKDSYWRFRGVLNHEVGHILGLSHTWAYNDGCDDTPRHPQKCWSRDAGPGCDTLTSNNVMDYSNLQLAYSPCQIGKIHARLSDERRLQRSFLIPNWCVLDESKDIVIRDTIDWACMKDLEGNLIIAPGGHLTIRCRVSVPPGASITVQSGGTLLLDGGHLHQACDERWEGVIVEKQNELEGVLELRGNYRIEDVEINDATLE